MLDLIQILGAILGALFTTSHFQVPANFHSGKARATGPGEIPNSPRPDSALLFFRGFFSGGRSRRRSIGCGLVP
jgi:hypothetical protein